MQYINGGGRAIRVFGRLQKGVSAAQALSMATPYLFESWMKAPGLRTVMRSLRDYQIGDVKFAAWLLFGAIFAILLIVCANVTSILLVRSSGQQREIAVRAALGAGRRRLFLLRFVESALLTALGSALAACFAWILLRIFKRLAPAGIPRLQQASVDSHILLLLIVSSFVLAAIFALFTASYKSEPELLTVGGRVAGRSSNFFRPLLTIAQIAASLTLLAISGLLIESLLNLQNVAPGIAVDHVTTAEIAVGPPRYPNAVSRQQFFETLAGRLRSLPGVNAVALSDTAPPIGFVHTRPARTLRVFGQPVSGSVPSGIVAWRSVSPDYFKALSIPILEGRSFNAQDATGKDNPIIINQTWARHLFGNDDPVGKAIKLNAGSLLTVVGIAADVKNNGLSQPTEPEYYTIRKQVTDPNEGRGEVLASRALHWYDGDAFVIVRGSARPAALASWIRSATVALDPTVPVSISTMQERVSTLSQRPRFTTILLSFFALIGVALAAIGLYGLISFLVIQRTQEVGVRMAMGATPARIARLMLIQALYWILCGVAIGALITALVARSLRSLLFEVPAENPGLFCLAAGLMIVVGLAATVIPSLRAARIDPVAALRRE